ncbi:hypothetical protein [Rubinisphaera italica]|uniref:Translocation protein TolB n=1 Tax=Rubinisphaera italica TaxID=2527969 RepID=A0A5C5XNA5_9PLAN|nr:hypothetical protein [Rubinisphaera italica]TWT64374.1 hypothetical protein Pan54_51360 [Rubinisphaera italica]
MHVKLLFFMIFVAACTSTGCVPAHDPVWTADSQSVIVSKSDGAVIQFDLKTKATRQLLSPASYRPSRIAISPDGKQATIAVAEQGQPSYRVAVQFVRISDGRSLSVEAQVWGEANAARNVVPTSAYWCPSGKRILICFADLNEIVRSVVYEPESKQFHEWNATPPAVMLCSTLNLSPILPDGSGYFGMKPTDNGYQFHLVQWDGWEHVLTPHNIDLPAAELLSPPDPQAAKPGSIHLGQAKWDERKLVIPMNDRTIVADFAARKLTTRPQAQSEQTAYRQAKVRAAKEAEGVSTQLVTFSKGGLSIVVHTDAPKGTQRVELIDSKTKGRRLLLSGISPIGLNLRAMTLSPDGLHVFVAIKQDGTPWGYFFKYDGSVVGKIKLGKSR